MKEKKIARIAEQVQIRAFHNMCVQGKQSTIHALMSLWGLEDKPKYAVAVDQMLAATKPLIEDFNVRLDVVQGTIDTACPKDFTFVLTKKILKTNIINTLQYMVASVVEDAIIKYHVNGGANTLWLYDVLSILGGDDSGFDVKVSLDDPAWYYLLAQVDKDRFCKEWVTEVGRYRYKFTIESERNPTIGADAIIKFARVV